MSKGETFSLHPAPDKPDLFHQLDGDTLCYPVGEGTALACLGRHRWAGFSPSPRPLREKKTASPAEKSAGLTRIQGLFVTHCQGTAICNNDDLADSGAFG